MNSLYLRIYGTVVAVLLLFALLAGWAFQSRFSQERERMQAQWSERAAGWAALLENSLPEAGTSREAQRAALLEWSERLRLPLALDDENGERIAASESFARREREASGTHRGAMPLALSDGRTLWVWRPGGRGEGRPPGGPRQRMMGPPGVPYGVGLVVTLAVLFAAIALGAYPVVRRLTRRLEALKQGVEAFGAGQLNHRVDATGNDEVAAVAASFNDAAERVETLVNSHRQLLANASHELRSPLGRLKMAVSLLETAEPGARARLKAEIEHNIRELDELVEEVLLASRLEAKREFDPVEPVNLLALAAEEGARFDAAVSGDDVAVRGEERLIRRALRNLLENARRYGGSQPPDVRVEASNGVARVKVCDRGPGVPPGERERIFEPFYRLPGHAEQTGGVGLGLSLVRQIAARHGGTVHVESRDGGGSVFVLGLPA
jgi:signal transduction histidine kinase